MRHVEISLNTYSINYDKNDKILAVEKIQFSLTKESKCLHFIRKNYLADYPAREEHFLLRYVTRGKGKGKE